MLKRSALYIMIMHDTISENIQLIQ